MSYFIVNNGSVNAKPFSTKEEAEHDAKDGDKVVQADSVEAALNAENSGICPEF